MWICLFQTFSIPLAGSGPSVYIVRKGKNQEFDLSYFDWEGMMEDTYTHRRTGESGDLPVGSLQNGSSGLGICIAI